ncbi:MAG: RNA-binding S4 domain-containing protein [Campylobacterales bacterium]|nr:RNA-binding S4 domain-containing protein [Campylobacterales bacterium]
MNTLEFKLQEEYIELYKLIKLLDLVDSGAQAKLIVADGYVLRNGVVETRKRAKIISGDILQIGDDVEITVMKA